MLSFTPISRCDQPRAERIIASLAFLVGDWSEPEFDFLSDYGKVDGVDMGPMPPLMGSDPVSEQDLVPLALRW